MPQDNLPPLRVREVDGSPNVIPVFDVILSNNLTLQNNGGGIVTISATTGAGGSSQAPITFPLIVGSGGTGQVTITSNRLLMGAGTAPITVVPNPLDQGEFYVGSDTSLIPFNFIIGGQGQVLSVNSSQALGLQWINSNALGSSSSVQYAATGNNYVVMNLAGDLTNEYRLVQSGNSITITTDANTIVINAVTGGGGGTQVISIPMALLSVEVNSGNAFWTAQTDTTRMDRAYVNMTDSGRSISTWWCEMPRNLNATPAWGIDITSEAALLGATGGFLVLNVDGMSTAVGESSNTLAASTIQLVAAGSFQLNTAGILSICTLTATNFDAALATSATDYVKIKLARQGNADTFNSDWYIYNVKINCTVNT